MTRDDFAVWGIALIVMVGIILRPLTRGWGRRLEGQAETGEMRREMDEMRERIAELEASHSRLQELEDRLDFAERVMAQRHEPLQLPEQRTPV